MSRRSDPPPALENAPTQEVTFPNDDYPPGFPCLSGCGKKFPTVMQLEIHIQFDCEGPYDEIGARQGTSVAAPQPPSASSASNHDRIVQWLASSFIGYVEPDPLVSPSYDAIAVDHDEDFAAGISRLEHPLLNPTGDAVAVNHNENFASGTSHLEPNPPPTLAVNAVVVNHNENFASGTGHLVPNPPLTSTGGAVAGNHNERFKCPVCGKCLTRQRTLNRHTKLHALGRFPCPVKGCKFNGGKSQGELIFHLREDHTDITEQRGGDRFACWYCGRNMKSKPTLMYHVELHKSGKFPCPVDNCPSSAQLTQGALDHHLKDKHTDDQISGPFL